MGSHDFIKFPPDLGNLSARTWLLLGEIQATSQRVRATPILPAHAYELDLQYLAKGVHGTTSVEGNTFAEEEVAKFIGEELPAYASRIAEVRQIKNMVDAFNLVARDEMYAGSPPFSLEHLNRYHQLVVNGLADSNGREARARTRQERVVAVENYCPPPPEEREHLMAQFCDWLNEEDESATALDGYDIARSIVKALVAHVYFSWIHPYGVGNGRMARLIEHVILLRAGIPEVATHVLSYFYSKTLRQYDVELQLSHGELTDGAYPPQGDLRCFVEYALEGFIHELNELVIVIGSMQVQALWRDHIHGCFPAKLTEEQQRRKRLALDLTDRCLDQPVPLDAVRDVSAAMRDEYAELSDQTLSQDLDTLIKMDLLVQDGNGYQPNPEIMMSLFGNSGLNSN